MLNLFGVFGLGVMELLFLLAIPAGFLVLCSVVVAIVVLATRGKKSDPGNE
jgi:hypothetical protein